MKKLRPANTKKGHSLPADVRRHWWKYHRDSRNGVSKWVLGNSWVTKWDKQRFCIIGILGERTDWKVGRPKAAREAIECVLGESPNGRPMKTTDCNESGMAGLGAARGSSACHACNRDTIGEMTWPGEAGHDICQECWEAECSRSWWVMMNALGAAGLLEPPNAQAHLPGPL